MNFRLICRTAFVFLLISLIPFNTFLSQANAQTDADTLRQLWLQGNYPEVIQQGEVLRAQPFQKTAEIDYMIGTSYCRLGDSQSAGMGQVYLKWCLSYPIDESIKETVRFELQQCGQTISGTAASIPINVEKASAGVESRSKMYHYLNKDNVVYNQPIRIVEAKSKTELQARLTAIGSTDAAVQKIRQLVDSVFDIRTQGKFVIASTNRNTDFDEITHRLEIYEKFFSSNFGLELPPYMLTVYVVPEIDELQRLALKLHGFDLPDASIGYSCRDDLSLLVYCRYRLTGTLFHELFHLMARTTFGDIPPWLDEGTASLYEVSTIAGDSVVGNNNWRGKVLRDLWHIRPSIQALAEMDWAIFDKVEPGDIAEKQAVNHATARSFIQYLQNIGKLSVVFNEIRRLNPLNCRGSREEASIKILQRNLQKTMDEIDTNFEQWFQTTRPWN